MKLEQEPRKEQTKCHYQKIHIHYNCKVSGLSKVNQAMDDVFGPVEAAHANGHHAHGFVEGKKSAASVFW